MPRTYEIHTKDGDPVVVDKVTEDGAGVRYTDPDGNQVFVPWGGVDKVVSYRTPDDVPAEVDEDGTYVLEPGPNAVTPPLTPQNEDDQPPAAKAEKAEKATKAAKKAAAAGVGGKEPAKGDPQATKASEWASADPDVVRSWAKDNGHEVADSGPLSKDVLSAYAAAHS
jgi:hypothetical protein